MYTKRIKRVCSTLVVALMIALCTAPRLAFALTYRSASYSLLGAALVSGGGLAVSQGYYIGNVHIGRITGGKSTSPNYSCDASDAATGETTDKPNRPVLDPVTTPTNAVIQAITGTKDAGTAIHVNGPNAVPLDNETTWSHDYRLSEGANELIITARNADELDSDPVYETIILDTKPPSITIDSPLDNIFVYLDPLSIAGKVDGVDFTEEHDLDFGLNTLTVQRTDEANNSYAVSIDVYLIREPLQPPEIPVTE